MLLSINVKNTYNNITYKEQKVIPFPTNAQRRYVVKTKKG